MIFTEKLEILWHKDHIHKIIPNKDDELDDNINAMARMTIICFIILSILDLNKTVLIIMLVFLVLLVLMKFQRESEDKVELITIKNNPNTESEALLLDLRNTENKPSCGILTEINNPIVLLEEDELDKFFPKTLTPINQPMDLSFFKKIEDETKSRKIDESKRNKMTQEEIRDYQAKFYEMKK